MAHATTGSGGARHIGALLCWGVVFADIGSSIYYVPGILFGDVGRPAAAFVALTGIAVLFLARKYVDITVRYPEGGGVVSAAHEAFGPLAGALGGMLISVGYFLTSAISAVSGFEYVSTVLDLGGYKTWLTCGALVLLGGLNLVGLKESAFFSAVMAVLAFVTVLITGGMALQQATAEDLARMTADLGSITQMTPLKFLEGYAGAWLAFSGLESMSQLSPAIAHPKHTVTRRAMRAVTWSILLTSPALTALSIAMLDARTVNPDHFISVLGEKVGGEPLQLLVVMTSSVLLLFASNTAIIGCYHVFVALARERLLPSSMANVNQRFGTPSQAIALAVLVPILVIVGARGSLSLLGHLYAFGLLGAFTLSSLAMDAVAWRERRGALRILVGVLTTLSVLVAWLAHMVFKPEATLFGGILVALGLALALAVRRGWLRGDTNLIPFLTAEGAEHVAESLPAMRKILSLQEAEDLLAVYPSGILLPVRGFRPNLLDAAMKVAREKGAAAVHMLFVDEVPGLFYPPKVGPSAEGIRTMAHCSQYVEERGMAAVPIWRLSHDAASSIAGAARRLRSPVVMLGASERNALWKVLRGSVLRGLKEKLDVATTLVVADTTGGGEARAVTVER